MWLRVWLHSPGAMNEDAVIRSLASLKQVGTCDGSYPVGGKRTPVRARR